MELNECPSSWPEYADFREQSRAFEELGAVVGIYGVLSYSVAQGTQEIGIRMALDAEEGTIAKIVVGQGLALILLSFAIGVLSALATAQVFLSLLYGVTLRDPLT